LEGTAREIQKKQSFQELSSLLVQGEALVGKYYCYMDGDYINVHFPDAETLSCWQQAESAGTHILRGMYAVK
jgi:hypothetical protein